MKSWQIIVFNKQYSGAMQPIMEKTMFYVPPRLTDLEHISFVWSSHKLPRCSLVIFKLAVVCFLLCQVQVLIIRLINSKYCWSIILTMTQRKIAEHVFFSGVALVFMSFKTFLMVASLWSEAVLFLHQGSTFHLSLFCYNSTEVIHSPQLKQSYNQWPQCSLVIRAALP